MAIQKAKTSALKTYLIAGSVALIGSKFFGLIADFFWKGQIRCFGIGDIGGCDSNNTALYAFGFYYGLIFWLSIAHFGFMKKSHKLFLLFLLIIFLPSLLGGWLFISALIVLALGSLIGLVLKVLRKA